MNKVFRQSSLAIHAVDQWSVPFAQSRTPKWSLCSSTQNGVFDEEIKVKVHEGAIDMETETMPINMFHSVLCGASHNRSTTDSSAKEVRADEKIPIVLLHGLLGSARNFQSWMKLVQQKESEIERDEHRILQVDIT